MRKRKNKKRKHCRFLRSVIFLLAVVVTILCNENAVDQISCYLPTEAASVLYDASVCATNATRDVKLKVERVAFGSSPSYSISNFVEEKQEASATIVDAFPDADSFGEYSGSPYVIVNQDTPYFTTEWNNISTGELQLSPLDRLGRCGAAIIKASPSTLPTDERGSTGQIRPTGWHQNKYEGIVDSEPPYLYNRAHLIMRAICGVDSDECLLITGTRYFNVEAMLPVEMEVLDRIRTGDTVLYRVTPIFDGDDLLARGVLMEARNESKSWSLCRFAYNVQPGVVLDYASGQNWAK
ncbi:MAG: DNA/RNA non-specific endonuclease [Eubacteriales bacterium]|nr:DNA/RNA non-specific endonuclease [Eubacteriales bacterium]